MNLGSEVRLEKLVELFVIILGEVNGFLLAPVLAVQDQVGVVVEDPLDLDVRILVDTAPLLEEPLDAGQPIEPSRVARDDLARLVSSRAMQRQERERQRSPDHHAALARRLACPRNGGMNRVYHPVSGGAWPAPSFTLGGPSRPAPPNPPRPFFLPSSFCR